MGVQAPIAPVLNSPLQFKSFQKSRQQMIRAYCSNIYTVVEGHKYDTKCLKYLFVAGEHCDHGTRVWAENQFQVPVLGAVLNYVGMFGLFLQQRVLA